MYNFEVISITDEKEVLKFVIKDFLDYSKFENRKKDFEFYQKLLNEFNSISFE